MPRKPPKTAKPAAPATIDGKRVRRKMSAPPADVVWFEERFEALGLTRAVLDRELGYYENYIGRIFSGQRKASIADAVFLAKRLKVPVQTIVRRLGYALADATVPVIGRVNEHGRIVSILPAHQAQVPFPPGMETETVAVVVETAQTALAVYDGQILYYTPSKIVRPDAFGRLSVIECADHSAPIVGILDRARVGRGRVVILGGTETLESEQIVSATPIRWKFDS